MRLHKICGHRRNYYHQSLTGFTLIEIIFVMSLLGLGAACGVLLGMDAYRGSVLSHDRDLIVTALQKARSQSMANIREMPHGVKIDKNQVIIFEGKNWESRVQVRDVSIQIGTQTKIFDPVEVVYEQLSGNGSVVGDIVLSNSSEQSVVISLNEAGLIKW